jgi:putative peptidoglycan lipid II flippase
MMKRVFLMLYNRSSGINEAAFLLGIFTFFSQILGLVRDRLLATYVGAGPELDSYYAAFKIPDLLFVSVATLASITVLLPMLNNKYQEENQQPFRDYINQIFTVLLYFLIGISIVLFFLIPVLVPLIAPGFDAEQYKLVTLLARIMLAQPILIGISGMLSSVTQFFKKFLITACTPVVYNVGIILGILFLYPMIGVSGLAIGVVIGAFFHMGIQIPFMIHQKTIPHIVTKINWKEVRSLVSLSIPRTIGLSINTITIIVLTAFASTLGSGSIALFSLTHNMLNVPLAIIGISYSVASFPVLVKYFNESNTELFIQRITQGAQKIIFFSMPVVFLFIVLRAQIVRVVLGTNSFSWNDTRIAAALLAVFVIGLVGQSLVHMFVRGMYAMGNTKKPLIINIISQVIVVVSAIGFLHLFTMPQVVSAVQNLLRLQGISDVRILALPLAFAIGNTINCILLISSYYTQFKRDYFTQVFKTFWQSLLASVGIAAAAYNMLQVGSMIFNQNTFWGIFAQGSLAGVVGIGIGVVILIILDNQDVKDFISVLKHKFWKATIVQDVS